VRVMGGKVQYLSQLEPVAVEEQTILAPPQPFAMDRSCQKHTISIAGKRYPWGIGVHADSSLTFEINKRFAEFRADVGVDTRMGNRGSVVFHVLGDGKELYKSPVVRGGRGRAAACRGWGRRGESAHVAGDQRRGFGPRRRGELGIGQVAERATKSAANDGGGPGNRHEPFGRTIVKAARYRTEPVSRGGVETL
jgi:hypothetical protein